MFLKCKLVLTFLQIYSEFLKWLIVWKYCRRHVAVDTNQKPKSFILSTHIIIILSLPHTDAFRPRHWRGNPHCALQDPTHVDRYRLACCDRLQPATAPGRASKQTTVTGQTTWHSSFKYMDAKTNVSWLGRPSQYVGGLIFYKGFFFLLLSSFFRQLLYELAERN